MSRLCEADKAVFRLRENEQLRPDQRRTHLAASDTYFKLSPSKPLRAALTAARLRQIKCL
jgi:hypothetical protein